MLSRTDFGDRVSDLYRNLYDIVHLRTHPLTKVLVTDQTLPPKSRGWHVHHLLLDAIAELDPGPDAPILSREWRRHQLMVMRFVDGLAPTTVADELSISRRQYFREQKAALDTIAEILWNRYVVDASHAQQETGTNEKTTSLERMELLRLEAARIRQSNRYARIPALVEGVLPLLQEILNKHEIQVQVSMPSTLPPASADPGLLRQILLGMLGYLAEFTEHATIQLVGRVIGPGMRVSTAIQPPASSTSTKESGSKERIAALQEIAELSGIQIVPLRDKQRVTGFELKLPVARHVVLVVDDNEDVLELFQRYLHSFGYRVAVARTAQKALTMARRMQPHAITLDLMMPDQDGWDLLQTLLHQPDTHSIPIIVCTVLKQKELALSLGATAFLEKPVSRQALLSTLRSLEEI